MVERAGVPDKVIGTRIEDGIGFIICRNPPVNALSTPVRAGLMAALEELLADPRAAAIVLLGEGRTFFAGGDIAEFGPDMPPPGLEEVAAAFVASPKPVIAAIHGFALGGGLEMAMSCGFRVATAEARVGLPEVTVGILAGAGGVQLLSRLAGPEVALEMVLSGRHVPAQEALATGILDAIGTGDPAEFGAEFARRVLAERRPLVPVPAREDKVAATRADPAAFEAMARTLTAPLGGQLAPLANVAAVRRSFTLPFADALAADMAASYKLLLGEQSRALRYLFFAERAAAKLAGDQAARENQIVARMAGNAIAPGDRLALLANAGARLLTEGIVPRAADIDIAWIHAGGWPRHEGGPMFQADAFGLKVIVERLRELADENAALAPENLLVQLAESGGRLTV